MSSKLLLRLFKHIFLNALVYRVSSDRIPMLQGVIPEVIPSQKYHMNTWPILNGYGTTHIWNSW